LPVNGTGTKLGACDNLRAFGVAHATSDTRNYFYLHELSHGPYRKRLLRGEIGYYDYGKIDSAVNG